MKKATRVFIDLRRPFCVMKPSIVSVNLLGGGMPNNCSENALNVTENGENNVHSITGWLIHPYNSASKTTQIVQHWWNKKVDGAHFDTTPSRVIGCDYVMDSDLLKFVIDNFDDINSNVATSILLHDSGLIEGYESDPSVPFFGARKVQLKSLSTKDLYGLN